LPEAQIDMFKTLIKVNGAGLIIKVGRYVRELPQEMYELADKHDMPIIALPIDVSFVNVLTVLFERIYEEKKAYQHEQLQLMNQLVNTGVKSLKDFLIELSSITGENVYYESDDHRLLTFVKKEGDKRRKNFDLLSHPQPIAKGLQKIMNRSNREWAIEEDRLIIPIDDAGECIGYLHIVLKRSKALIGALQSCIVSIKEQTKLLLLKDQYEVEKRYLQENKFLKHLIQEKKVNQDQYVQKRLDTNEKNVYGLFALDLSCIGETLQSSREKDQVIKYFINKKIYEIVDRDLPKTFLYNEGSYFYGLYICKDQQSRPLIIDKLRRIVKQVENEFNDEIYCGVSLAHDSLLDLYKGMDEAKLALQMRNDMGLNDKIIIYEQMGINKILLKLKHDADVLHFLTMTIEALKFDDNENGELIHTLDVFLQENGNHSKASEKLFIHRRTLKYRLTKIESILNINLDDSDTRFLLYFLLKMRKIHLT
jgi:purine catabolism regulator